MSRPLCYTLRFAAILVALATLSAVLTPSTPATSPYASALSGIGMVTDAMAAKACADKACDSTGAIRCVRQVGFRCGTATGCISGPCSIP
jgi:disulfide bond formation protein DsbB